MNVTQSLVKELREKTSAGMLDCKKALEEAKGNIDKAVEWLRKNGITKVAKKSSRIAAEGVVASYIHAEGSIGVLLEVNSETDFVARNEEFKTFTKDIAMHIAASSPQYVSYEDVPQHEIEKERSILSQRALKEGKKKEFLDKILEGQIKKWMSDICLLEQPFIKNQDKKVKDHLNELIVKTGERIVIRRFVRFELGEGIEKDEKNFAEEVAQQMKNS